MKNSKIEIPPPSTEQVEHYLKMWETYEGNKYRLQEEALNKLFFDLCPKNKERSDILLKVATLNDFYSTNIFAIYPVAERILLLNIDARLEANDISLVYDIQRVNIRDSEKNFYSFATKYCSHHKPLEYPIYDSYVEKVLWHFQKCDKFASFKRSDLKDYVIFKEVLKLFQKYYGLTKYNLKQIDQYLWLLGKTKFPKNYKNAKSAN